MTLTSRMWRVINKFERLANSLGELIPEEYKITTAEEIVYCKICKKVVDISKVHVIVFIDDIEVPHHVECFYKNYTVEVEGES